MAASRKWPPLCRALARPLAAAGACHQCPWCTRVRSTWQCARQAVAVRESWWTPHAVRVRRMLQDTSLASQPDRARGCSHAGWPTRDARTWYAPRAAGRARVRCRKVVISACGSRTPKCRRLLPSGRHQAVLQQHRGVYDMRNHVLAGGRGARCDVEHASVRNCSAWHALTSSSALRRSGALGACSSNASAPAQCYDASVCVGAPWGELALQKLRARVSRLAKFATAQCVDLGCVSTARSSLHRVPRTTVACVAAAARLLERMRWWVVGGGMGRVDESVTARADEQRAPGAARVSRKRAGRGAG